MDILRKELNAVYASQRLGLESLDRAVVDDCRRRVAAMVSLTGACAVITDASCDRCYIEGGGFATLLGLTDDSSLRITADSSDEDEIYSRLHPEDLVDKRLLEYDFFRFVDKLPAAEKVRYKATCRIRIRDRHGDYRPVDNSTQVLRTSPAGKIWLILCCYDLASDAAGAGINPCIVNHTGGQIAELSLSSRRSSILTAREKQILAMIRDGKLSKQIADMLGISVNTVNRHRQNILEKLSVGNSVEAIVAATQMKII